MTSQRDLDIMWLEAMEEIDKVEVEFFEMLRGNDGEKKNETDRGTETATGRGTQGGIGGEGFGGAAPSNYPA